MMFSNSILKSTPISIRIHKALCTTSTGVYEGIFPRASNAITHLNLYSTSTASQTNPVPYSRPRTTLRPCTARTLSRSEDSPVPPDLHQYPPTSTSTKPQSHPFNSNPHPDHLSPPAKRQFKQSSASHTNIPTASLPRTVNASSNSMRNESLAQPEARVLHLRPDLAQSAAPRAYTARQNHNALASASTSRPWSPRGRVEACVLRTRLPKALRARAGTSSTGPDSGSRVTRAVEEMCRSVI